MSDLTRFDAIGMLRALVDQDVRFVVIGGVAAQYSGSPITTRDLDVCYARDPENLEALAAVLRDLGAALRGAPAGLPFRLDARTLARGDAFTFTTILGDLDIIGTPAGTDGYDDLVRNASIQEVDGIRLRVAAIDDLMRMKRAAGRTKDLIHLEHLGALRDELDRQP